MSLGLPQHELAETAFVLALGGTGPLTGLEIISRLGLHPREVVIEANVALTPPDAELVDELFRPGFYQLRAYVPAFRQEFRPVNVILNWNQPVLATPALDAAVPSEHPDPDVLQRTREANRKIFDRPIPEAQMSAGLARLRYHVDDLERGGTRVFFMEMPVDPILRGTGIVKDSIAALRREFPPDRFRWIEFSRLGPFETRDGVHLLRQDAVRIARSLRQGLQ